MEMHLWLSEREIDCLLQMHSNVDWRVYIKLRKRADFRSGRLTHPSALRMTHASIARQVSVQSSRGVKAFDVEGKEVSRSIERLVRVGLIDELDYEGGYLRLRLPLVKGDVDNEPESDGKLSQSADDTKPILSRPEATEKPAVRTNHVEEDFWEDDSDEEDGSRLSQQEEGEIAVSLENTASDAIPDSCVNNTVNSLNKNNNPPSIMKSGGQGSPSAKRSTTKTNSPAKRAYGENPEKDKGEDEAARFCGIVRDEGKGGIRYLDTALSREIYASWKGLNVSESDLRNAVREVLSRPQNPPTPTSIDKELREQFKARNKPRTLHL